MSSSATAVAAARSIIYLGLDVHKDAITIAVLPVVTKAPTRLERLPNDLGKVKKCLDRLAHDGELRACYEASGAGYVLHRAVTEWGYACGVIAPSLIPKRPGVQRKHDKRDAADLARPARAGELVVVRIPSVAEERVRDVVRCREIVQREILKSRHYILTFLARRGFVSRDGTNWCTPHLKWLRISRRTRPRSRAKIVSCIASSPRCCCISCSDESNWIARPSGSPGCQRSRRWCDSCHATAALRAFRDCAVPLDC